MTTNLKKSFLSIPAMMPCISSLSETEANTERRGTSPTLHTRHCRYDGHEEGKRKSEASSITSLGEQQNQSHNVRRNPHDELPESFRQKMVWGCRAPECLAFQETLRTRESLLHAILALVWRTRSTWRVLALNLRRPPSPLAGQSHQGPEHSNTIFSSTSDMWRPAKVGQELS